MKNILFLILLTHCAIHSFSQNHFAEYLTVGTSLTYMHQSTKDDVIIEKGYNEYIWNTNVGIQLSKRFFAGLQYINIYSSEIFTPKERFLMYGAFTQCKVYAEKNYHVFLETSISKGNYCSVGVIPIHREGLYYLGLGFGAEVKIPTVSNLYLDLSFVNYNMINKIEDKYAHNQYVVGLNYRFNRK